MNSDYDSAGTAEFPSHQATPVIWYKAPTTAEQILSLQCVSAGRLGNSAMQAPEKTAVQPDGQAAAQLIKQCKEDRQGQDV